MRTLATIVRMRTPRIKVPAEEGEATYHCMSRTVNREWLFDDTAREVLRKHLWQTADFCGVMARDAVKTARILPMSSAACSTSFVGRCAQGQ